MKSCMQHDKEISDEQMQQYQGVQRAGYLCHFRMKHQAEAKSQQGCCVATRSQPGQIACLHHESCEGPGQSSQLCPAALHDNSSSLLRM